MRETYFLNGLRNSELHTECATDCSWRLAKKETLARMVRRNRAAPDGELEENMRITRNEEFFSLHEDGITIFTTAENLNMLRRSRHWISDGTFNSDPHDHQLFTIHAVMKCIVTWA